jgi:adenosylcobyric acid synthase
MKNQAKTVMIQGTGSGVGKSVLTAALCRIFVQDGYSTAPFKAQNMALNSFVTPSGGEIGRAQAVQAQAARVVPTVDMNPVLIKPSSDTKAQIVVLGKPFKTQSASEYMGFRGRLFATVKRSLKRLRGVHDIVVIEGAGSPAEVNLRKNDIVNMSVALAARSPVILTADIDKGGALASIVGTLELLSASERKLVKGFIINKFRGDKRLFEGGVNFLEKRTGLPVLGVVPYFRDIEIPEEDAIPWEKRSSGSGPRRDIRISVICLPHLSNFTDFDCFDREPDVELIYVRKSSELLTSDAIIIPGTKSTISDLVWLKRSGLAKMIMEAVRKKCHITGICGGYQILGEKISDPVRIESAKISVSGLSLLPVETTLEKQKQLRQVSARSVKTGLGVSGYEIHHGKTRFRGDCTPVFRTIPAGEFDGASNADGSVWGSYIHGVFDSPGFRRDFINALRIKKGLEPLPASEHDPDSEFDKLAEFVRENIDMKTLYAILKS